MASTTTTTTGTTPESTTSTTTAGYYPYDYWTNPDYRHYWGGWTWPPSSPYYRHEPYPYYPQTTVPATQTHPTANDDMQKQLNELTELVAEQSEKIGELTEEVERYLDAHGEQMERLEVLLEVEDYV